MLSKTAQIPTFKTIIIIFTLGILLIVYFVMLFQASKIEINDKKLTQQLVLHNIISKNCFSSENQNIATVNIGEFNQKNLDNCVSQFKDSSSLKISIEKEEAKTMYFNQEDFQNKVRFKNIVTTSHYSKHQIPVILIDEISGSKPSFLNIEIITQ